VAIAANGPKAARLAGEKGDGLMATDPRTDLVDAFGKKSPRCAEVAMCCAKDEAKARGRPRLRQTSGRGLCANVGRD